VVPSLFAISQLFAEVDILPDGSADDAPMRGAGLFLLIGLPICYAGGCLYCAAVGHVLSRWRRLSLKATLSLATIAPWPFFVMAALGLVSNSRNVTTELFVWGTICIFASLFAVLGALTWWFIAIGKQPSNQLLQRTAMPPAER
jgi:hypothetical protein